ncbi:MAG: hypothetical protein R2724_27270 [Bryobacterales bacterium]
MFERINSTGTQLNAVDFIRAVTWSRDFDLNVEINELAGELEAEGFEVPVETLVKALLSGGWEVTYSGVDVGATHCRRVHFTDLLQEARSHIEEARGISSQSPLDSLL